MSLFSVQITESMLQKHYDEFYEEVFYEIESKYGEIEEMNVCENLGDHIVGNVYIKFYKLVLIKLKRELLTRDFNRIFIRRN